MFNCFIVPQMAKYYSNGDNCDPRSIEHLKEHLKNYGKVIKHIDFVNTKKIRDTDLFYTMIQYIPVEYLNEIFASIVMFCSDKVKSLKMCYVDFDPNFFAHVQDTFKHLTKLEIYDESNWPTIFSKCSNLDTLIMKFRP